MYSITTNEAQQTETSEFGAENVLLQAQARRTGGSCSKIPDFSKESQQSIKKKKLVLEDSQLTMS